MHARLRSAAASPSNIFSQTSHCCKYESVKKELGTRPSVTVYALTVHLGHGLKVRSCFSALHAVLIMRRLNSKHFQNLMVRNVPIYTDTGSYLMLLLLCCLLKCTNPWVFWRKERLILTTQQKKLHTLPKFQNKRSKMLIAASIVEWLFCSYMNTIGLMYIRYDVFVVAI